MCSWPCLLPILQTYKLQPITLVTITNGAATQAAAWQKQAQTVNNTVVPTQFQMDTVADLLGTSKALAIISFVTEHLATAILEIPLTKLSQDDAIRLSHVLLKQAMYPDQDAVAGVAVSQSTSNKHVLLLRSALLLLKTVEVIAEDDSQPLFVHALWNAIKQTAGSMQDYHSKAHTRPENTHKHTSAEGAEAARLALLLVGTTLPMLRRSLTACSYMPGPPYLQTNPKAAAHEHKALPCTLGILCQLLVCVLTASSQCAVMHQSSQLCVEKVVESGGLELLVAALDGTREVAQGAFKVLWCLLDRELLPAEQVAKHEAELAGLHGLRRCSALMSHTAGCHQQASEACDPESLQHEFFDGEVFEIKFLWQVASVMVRLQLHQLPPRSNLNLDKSDRDSSQLWQAPTYLEWEDIQAAACRLFTILDWARKEAAAAETPLCENAYNQLKETLLLLLTQLLIGHLQDDDLNMQRLFRFGLKPMLEEWTAAQENSCALQLGNAFLRRLSGNMAVPMSHTNGDLYHGPDGICSMWRIFGQSAMPEQLMQAKKAMMMAVLYAVPATMLDATWLVRHPLLLKGFHAALKALPDSPERLSGLALSVRLCVIETPGKPFSTPSALAWPYCDEAQGSGLFDLLYTTLEHVLKASPNSWSIEHYVGVARFLIHCSRLFANMPHKLPQPKVAVLKHAIISLGEWAEFIIKSHELQPEMHLLQVAQLEFIASLQCIYPSADEDLQAVLLQMLPQYQHMGNAAAAAAITAGEQSSTLVFPPQLPPRTHDILGLLELQPDTFQSTLLSKVQMEDLHQHPELAEAAYASCMKWFVDTVTSAMHLPAFQDQPLISGNVMSPYLQLIRTVIGDLFSDPDPKLLLEVCLASLRLLYLMLQELCKLQQHLRVCTASYAMWIRQEPDGLCPQAIATPEEKKQRYVARRRQLASEVQQMKTCLVNEILPLFHKMSKDASWGSAMAAMEPDEWCWQNPCQYPVQASLDELCAEGVLEDTHARKANMFFYWFKRIRQAETAAKAARDAEDRALKASEELLAEEEQQHAQAAAKLAKKQRQKAKKRQDKVSKQAQDLLYHPPLPQQQAPQQQAPQLQTPQQQSLQLQLMPQQQSSRQQSPQQRTPPITQPQTPRQLTPRQQTPQQHSPCQPTAQQQEETQDDAATKQEQASVIPHRLLCCPITKVLMTDPVIAADGYTYERAALLQGLQHSHVSPVTGDVLEHISCVPNAAIRRLLRNSIC